VGILFREISAKQICNAYEVKWYAMHLTFWNIGPPSLMLHRHRVAFFALQSLLCFSMHWLIHVLVIRSVINAVPILGCPRWLLLSLFIKLDNAPKCSVAWFIIKKLNKSFISWILSRIVLWLIVRIVPTPIKIVNQLWTRLQLKHTLQVYAAIHFHGTVMSFRPASHTLQ